LLRCERELRRFGYRLQQGRRFLVEERRQLRENFLHAGDGLFLRGENCRRHSAMLLPEFQRTAVALNGHP
jgi:hypothetical protein